MKITSPAPVTGCASLRENAWQVEVVAETYSGRISREGESTCKGYSRTTINVRMETHSRAPGVSDSGYKVLYKGIQTSPIIPRQIDEFIRKNRRVSQGNFTENLCQLSASSVDRRAKT
jgi:hypothetical protein